MTVLEALAILESAVMECKKRDINTPEVKEALDSLECYVWPKWLSLQFRHHAPTDWTNNHVDQEAQQDVRRATFPGIRDAVRVLLEVRMDALARKFHETKDLKVSDEIYRLSRELIKLDDEWVFRLK